MIGLPASTNGKLQHFTSEHEAAEHISDHETTQTGSKINWPLLRRVAAFSHFFLVLLFKGNEFIRDVFELGPPILVDSATMKAMKISRFERVGVNMQKKKSNLLWFF